MARGEPDRPFVISARAESLANGQLLTWMRIEFVLGPALIFWGLLGLPMAIDIRTPTINIDGICSSRTQLPTMPQVRHVMAAQTIPSTATLG